MSEEKKTGKPLSADAAKVRAHLAALSDEGLRALTLTDYAKRTHHHVKRTIFSMEKTRARKLRNLPAQGGSGRPPGALSKPKAAAALPVAAPAGRQVEFLASIPLADYADVPAAKLKAFALQLVGQVLAGSPPEVVILSDPPTLEVRRRI